MSGSAGTSASSTPSGSDRDAAPREEPSTRELEATAQEVAQSSSSEASNSDVESQVRVPIRIFSADELRDLNSIHHLHFQGLAQVHSQAEKAASQAKKAHGEATKAYVQAVRKLQRGLEVEEAEITRLQQEAARTHREAAVKANIARNLIPYLGRSEAPPPSNIQAITQSFLRRSSQSNTQEAPQSKPQAAFQQAPAAAPQAKPPAPTQAAPTLAASARDSTQSGRVRQQVPANQGGESYHSREEWLTPPTPRTQVAQAERIPRADELALIEQLRQALLSQPGGYGYPSRVRPAPSQAAAQAAPAVAPQASTEAEVEQESAQAVEADQEGDSEEESEDLYN